MQFYVYIVLLKCLYFSRTPELIQANTDISVCVVVAQSCLILCNPKVATQLNETPLTVAHGNSPGKNAGVGCHALLQGIFPTQASNPALPHCR